VKYAANDVFYPKAYLSTSSMFYQTGVSTKGAPNGQIMSREQRIFWPVGLFMACCDTYEFKVHLLQHDILWPRELLYAVF